jgi:hypothetical protein
MIYSPHHMETNVLHHVYVAVTQLALDGFWMFSLDDKKTGIRVPEVMKPNPGQIDSPKGKEELFTDVFYSIFACGLL